MTFDFLELAKFNDVKYYDAEHKYYVGNTEFISATTFIGKFKPKFDCLSLDATNQLLDLLNPRLVFNGHTHYSCFNEVYDIPEYTIASFSWRNIKTPSMLLVIIIFMIYLIINLTFKIQLLLSFN
jgi:hypothetical protein